MERRDHGRHLPAQAAGAGPGKADHQTRQQAGEPRPHHQHDINPGPDHQLGRRNNKRGRIFQFHFGLIKSCQKRIGLVLVFRALGFCKCNIFL